ncbi:hypothetical protein RIF29_22764 [Crotalaria pallida]|uniref:F-box domain-containing protein n=1 Tax=Crotalaria pallida TaxID=3830 RepID=A0AAN9F702_CROPI
MKLRLRSLESKETLKIVVPDSCSLQQLKETISGSISSSSSSSSSPSSIHLSLNRNDEIHASSPHLSLKSIGIASGDLVFYTLNPTAFSRETLIHKPSQFESNSRDEPTLDIDMSDAPSIPEHEKSPTLDVFEAETMDTVDGSVAAVPVSVGKSNSQNSFLKSVLSESLGDGVNDFKLLVSGVHAVFLESGFVLADKAVGDFPSVFGRSTTSFRYSLPEIMNNNSSDIKTVTLKFPSMGHFVKVYGSLSDVAGSGLPELCLDKSKFARPLEKMLNDGDGDDDIFEFWKMVKDKLALPLLIDLCDEAGLDPPPCFMCLPSDLKLKILELVPGADLAKMAFMSRELRYLSSSNDLWKLKFEEEFGQVGSGGKFFKDMFALHWVSKKKRLRLLLPYAQPRLPQRVRFFPVRDPNPFGVPSIVGGDYDRLPGFGLPLPAYPPRRSFLPPCNWRRFNN